MKRYGTRPLPKVGDRINCDPNRDDPDCPYRWTNRNRRSGVVVKVFKDQGLWLIVYRVWNPVRQSWVYHVESELWWDVMTCWAIGPLPKPPKEK